MLDLAAERTHLEVVDTGRRLHVVRLANLTVCGRHADPADRYGNREASWRVWMAQPERRCFYCLSALRRETGLLVINAWTTECGECGYGRGGWASSPAREGNPVLTPESTECPRCGVRFTESLNLYTGERKPIESEAA